MSDNKITGMITGSLHGTFEDDENGYREMWENPGEFKQAGHLPAAVGYWHVAGSPELDKYGNYEPVVQTSKEYFQKNMDKIREEYPTIREAEMLVLKARRYGATHVNTLLDNSPSTSDLKRDPPVFSVLPLARITPKSYPNDSKERGETV